MKPGEKKNLSSRRTQASFAVTAAVFRDKTKILTADMTPCRMVAGY
jgi:hypothetical protein